jgi:hypothetical protein
MRRALIDTNIYSLALRGEPSVLDRLQQLDENRSLCRGAHRPLATGTRRGSNEPNLVEVSVSLEKL